MSKMVLVRTYSAGVHFGRMVERNGKEVVLADARRIWSWSGANTLNEIANHGVSPSSRVSEPVASNTLTEAIEIIEMSAEDVESMARVKWQNK